MYIVLGATGHVGSATANALLSQGQPVTVVTRTPQNAAKLQRQGAHVAVADVHDSAALRHIFQQGKRLFLLNPPADPSGDTDVEEHTTIAAIVAALEGSDLESIVALSTYGAQPGERIGDLTVLYDLEQLLKAQPIPVTSIRAAYYMSNWDASLQTAREEGIIHTLFPADLPMPMVAPHDIGTIAARLLTESVEQMRIEYVEGPERYSSNDVATAFAQALGKTVQAHVVPRTAWQQTFTRMGFSDAAAQSYTRMIAVSVDGRVDMPDTPTRGTTTLHRYITELCSS